MTQFFSTKVCYIQVSISIIKQQWAFSATPFTMFSRPCRQKYECKADNILYTLRVDIQKLHLPYTKARLVDVADRVCDLGKSSLAVEKMKIEAMTFLDSHESMFVNNAKEYNQSTKFKNRWPPCCQIWIIFTHLILWIASAGHNCKCIGEKGQGHHL